MQVNGRIMVDWSEWASFGGTICISNFIYTIGTFQDIVPNYDLPAISKTLSGAYLDPYTQASAAAPQEIMEEGDITGKHDDTPAWEGLTDEQLVLASPLVYGFSLADKLWCKILSLFASPHIVTDQVKVEFTVDNVIHFEWDDEPFTNLVLPRDQKQVVLSLVEAHSLGISQGFDDFVKGKGQGLVVNLFGNPGVGKSLTAEATSERTSQCESNAILLTGVFCRR